MIYDVWRKAREWFADWGITKKVNLCFTERKLNCMIVNIRRMVLVFDHKVLIGSV
jgi:hypothetical protein